MKTAERIGIVGVKPAVGELTGTYGISQGSLLHVAESRLVLASIGFGDATGFRFSVDGDITAVVADINTWERPKKAKPTDVTDEQMDHIQALQVALRERETELGAPLLSEFTGIITPGVAQDMLYSHVEFQTVLTRNDFRTN